jgi:hypothetical protein
MIEPVSIATCLVSALSFLNENEIRKSIELFPQYAKYRDDIDKFTAILTELQDPSTLLGYSGSVLFSLSAQINNTCGKTMQTRDLVNNFSCTSRYRRLTAKLKAKFGNEVRDSFLDLQRDFHYLNASLTR